MKSLFGLFIKKKVRRFSPAERSRILFENRAKDQFKRLKDKGLSITVFSL